jgi:hypothetical protein
LIYLSRRHGEHGARAAVFFTVSLAPQRKLRDTP